MKTSLFLLLSFISAQAFSYSTVDSTVLTSATPLLSSATTSGSTQGQAKAILADAQAFIHSGKKTAFLSQEIKNIQELNNEASEEDALEFLINEAQEILR